MRGIALALGGSPYEFEGERAGDAFWVFRIIGYPGVANGHGKPENDIGWYCNKAALCVFPLLFIIKAHIYSLFMFAYVLIVAILQRSSY